MAQDLALVFCDSCGALFIAGRVLGAVGPEDVSKVSSKLELRGVRCRCCHGSDIYRAHPISKNFVKK